MKEAKKEAIRWLDQAEDDFKFVKWVKQEGMFHDKGCFISQQAGEKVLKACLYATGKRRVFGHSLYEMVAELKKVADLFKNIESQAKRLDRFYIATRYPNGLPGGTPFQLYSKDDLEDAIDDLNQVFEVSRHFLKMNRIIAK